ncbi:hypothetical protein [Faecalispora jeddahensis]|uniref:hypothetical protein n=1 Tax=Faecalispora jeddahensis TaxID=1414721 RepID=UPI00145B7D7E|nr:hypothetical protein [Faecalispora jeddahensis]
MASFTLTFQQIAGGADFAPIVGVSDLYEYKDGKPTSTRLGSRYIVLLLSDGCFPLAVRVEDAEAPVISQEELDKHNTSMNFVLARFEGFTARPYVDRAGRMQLSAKADRIVLVKEGAAK